MKLSEILVAAKTYVWDGEGEYEGTDKDIFMCFALDSWYIDIAEDDDSVGTLCTQVETLKRFISRNLEGWSNFESWWKTSQANYGKPSPSMQQFQQMRLQWVDTLIAELQKLEAEHEAQ